MVARAVAEVGSARNVGAHMAEVASLMVTGLRTCRLMGENLMTSKREGRGLRGKSKGNKTKVT